MSSWVNKDCILTSLPSCIASRGRRAAHICLFKSRILDFFFRTGRETILMICCVCSFSFPCPFRKKQNKTKNTADPRLSPWSANLLPFWNNVFFVCVCVCFFFHPLWRFALKSSAGIRLCNTLWSRFGKKEVVVTCTYYENTRCFFLSKTKLNHRSFQHLLLNLSHIRLR